MVNGQLSMVNYDTEQTNGSLECRPNFPIFVVIRRQSADSKKNKW